MLEWRQHFARHAAPMLRERVGDLTDVHIRVLSILLGLPDHDPVDVPKGANAILVTHDLTPSLTVQLDRDAIAAHRDRRRHAHGARRDPRALARACRPSSGCATPRAELHGGERAVLDGVDRHARHQPDATTEIDGVPAARASGGADEAELRAARDARGRHDSTACASRCARTSTCPRRPKRRRRSGAEGVGLMRTEFLVVGRADHAGRGRAVPRLSPRASKRSRDSPVVIRTFDIGGDKLPVGGYPARSRIRSSAGAPSACASTSRSCSRCSCARCCAPRCTATCASCCRSSSRSTRCARRGGCSTRRRRSSTARGVAFRARRPARRHGRDARGGRRAPTRSRSDVDVLQHRDERSRAVHAGRRSRQREPRAALHAAASRRAAADQAHRGGRPSRAASTSRCAARWRPSRSWRSRSSVLAFAS